MRFLLLYGAFSLGARPVDVARLYSSPRGLTGSEVSFFEVARRLARRGHEVALSLPRAPASPLSWEGCDVFSSPPRRRFDAALAWNEPDLLRDVDAGLRVVNQQLNDFLYASEGSDALVDVYTSPSEVHLEHLVATTGRARSKIEVLPNGVDSSAYSTPSRKVRGRVVYASSPDRGLHLLLSIWPRILRRAPHAVLRVFYDLERWLRLMAATTLGDEPSPDLVELIRRADYVRFALGVLPGVEAIGGVSRDRIREEMLAAEVFAYPCEPVRFTEGFSVATLEACAARAAPVVAGADALHSIYSPFFDLAPAPASEHLREFEEMVVEALLDPPRREALASAASAASTAYDWERVVDRLEAIVASRLPSSERLAS